jgi:hydrogenase nickel incorporation protein HypA/HybF
MHELSIAQSIVSIAEDEVRKHKARAVSAIELDIGELSGLEMNSFDFMWPLAIKGSVLDGSERLIHKIAGKARCKHCGKTFALSQIYTACPKCQSYQRDILQGRELSIKNLKIAY